jgi:hypothetical protein
VAAGVAEGTIFGVFESKQKLVVCSMVKALDPQPTTDRIAAIDPALPLRERLTQAADLVLARFSESAHLLQAFRQLIIHGGHREMPAEAISGRERMHAAIAALIEPDAALLRRSPGSVARTLLLFCGANTFGPYADPDELTGADLVSLLLDGLLIRDEHTRGAQ